MRINNEDFDPSSPAALFTLSDPTRISRTGGAPGRVRRYRSPGLCKARAVHPSTHAVRSIAGLGDDRMVIGSTWHLFFFFSGPGVDEKPGGRKALRLHLMMI